MLLGILNWCFSRLPFHMVSLWTVKIQIICNSFLNGTWEILQNKITLVYALWSFISINLLMDVIAVHIWNLEKNRSTHILNLDRIPKDKWFIYIE